MMGPKTFGLACLSTAAGSCECSFAAQNIGRSIFGCNLLQAEEQCVLKQRSEADAAVAAAEAAASAGLTTDESVERPQLESAPEVCCFRRCVHVNEAGLARYCGCLQAAMSAHALARLHQF